ncbi:uncharacterized protein LOC125959358 [Anopheles darlingi]|uniref:uncharacterized protein LOC125959358 n=1 Tax=Anopheles darlingi TaxID=43151 RepID=UPI00210043F4|nr:uncharacterized protein LOC125959358 [Anopheles darlingi]
MLAHRPNRGSDSLTARDRQENKTVESFESVHFHLDELIHQLETIEESITLARHNIPSSRIISAEEIILAQEFLKNSGGLATNAVDDILDTSTAYVLFEEEIIYTLKVPRIKNVEYTLSYIEPVISDGHRIHLTSTYYLKGPGSFLSKDPCIKHMRQYVCDYSQLEPLDECVQQLVHSRSARCPMEKMYERNIIDSAFCSRPE